MTQPVLPLLLSNLRAWFGTKGFAMVAVAALVPLALTGAWVATHRADLTADSLTWDKSAVRDGDVVNITGLVSNTGPVETKPFNATLEILQPFARPGGDVGFRPIFTNVTTVPALAPGATHEVKTIWDARAGSYVVTLNVDQEDEVGEVDEYDNLVPRALAVGFQPPDAASPPEAPVNLTGPADAASLADAAVGAVSRPDPVFVTDNVTFRVEYRNDGPTRLENATVVLRLGRDLGPRFVASEETSRDVSLDPGERGTLELNWTAVTGGYWIEAYVNVTGNQTDPDGANNRHISSFAVDPKLELEVPEPEERQTIKDFYGIILRNLHLAVLIPLIALFYGAGVITDERERGTLPYLLTRPLPRWLIPATKFLASFAVAAVALVLGLVATYFLLFQSNPQGADAGLLATPLLVSLAALFAYGAFFILLGVMVDRPYLVGLALVLGWEVIAPLFVPFVKFLTIRHWVTETLVDAERPEHLGWALDKGLQWVPEGPEGMFALRIVLLIGLGSLVAASIVMKQREFEV